MGRLGAKRRERARLHRFRRVVGEVRGLANQERVLALLEYAVRAGLINGVWATEHNGSDDENGIDLWIVERSGERQPLQVKSSLYWAGVFRQKHPDIPVVVVGLNDRAAGRF